MNMRNANIGKAKAVKSFIKPNGKTKFKKIGILLRNVYLDDLTRTNLRDMQFEVVNSRTR
ncbi:hypothetical protein O9G_005945 [Rozella allomycis CSF55]|uniref:Uncharacterized protein n=1 Tax=Rozella allomycis (strain CSF55) TaxID=988480 RepID=A0A075B2H9_ROZAC|nr:hypothetical protein O9G_005945 [Rozella allomycis CSF55]|eukprot:EPZ36757.1 hypothetical protein O9G_005945 [Rozella allomycis CSF55]